MYAGLLLFYPGAALLLEFWLGVLLRLVLNGMFIVRTVLEDNMLATELDGYAAYRQRVTHRLIPGVW